MPSSLTRRPARRLGRTRCRYAWGAAGVALALAAAGCSGDEPPPTPTETPSQTDTATSNADAEATAEITTVFEKYWDAVIASQNGPEADAALFEGIAEGPIVESLVGSAQGLVSEGIRRTGEPIVGEPVITVDGESARLEACVDESGWGAVQGDTKLPADTRGATPRVFVLGHTGDTWLVTGTLAQSEATISC